MLKLVAPVRERGLKFYDSEKGCLKLRSRSRKGAWIEMCVTAATAIRVMVAPVRERGLK